MTIHGWSKQDLIRWVEQRLRERRAKEAGKFTDDLDAKGIPDTKSLQVWLAKERDGLSWQQIVIKYYREYRSPGDIKVAGISKARRAYMLVARRLEPTARQGFRYHMDETIRQVFGCSPEDFKRYINSIRTDRRRKKP
jgi:hypothetical protein